MNKENRLSIDSKIIILDSAIGKVLDYFQILFYQHIFINLHKII